MADKGKQKLEKKGKDQADEGAEKKMNKMKKEQPDKKKEQPKASREQIMRISETNLDGNKPVFSAIRRVRGVGHMMANAIRQKSDFSGKKLGELNEQEMRSLEDMIANPQNYGIPSWMFNRRKDPMTGKDRHISVSALDFQHKVDINELKKMRCYKGVRHSLGLPVRGQRTRSSFRKGSTVGVIRKKEAPKGGGAAAAAGGDKK